MPVANPVPELAIEPKLPAFAVHLCNIYVRLAPSPDHLFLLADALDEMGQAFAAFPSGPACVRRAAELRTLAPRYA